MEKLPELAFKALGQFPIVQAAVALVVLGVGYLMVRGALREKPKPQPMSVPIQIESPWLVQHLVEMHLEVETIKGRLDVISNQIAGIAGLLKRRQRRQRKTDSPK